MRPTDTSNIQEVCTYLLCLPAFADLLEASDVQNIEKLVGPDDKVTAHESVRLVYASRGSIAEQSRQAKIIVPALVDDIRTRAATFLPGGKVASMTEEQKERISTAELNQDRVESTFGMKGEMQRSAPNEKHHTSEARSVARVNKPITSEPMQKLTPPQRTQSWTAARQLSRVIEQERPQKEAKLLQRKVENVRETMEDAERKERKETEEQAKYAQTKLIETVQDLDNLLDDTEDADVRVDIMRDQIGAWNARKIARKMAVTGKENVLRKRLTKFLSDREHKVAVADIDQRPKPQSKRKASKKERPVSKRRNSDPGPARAARAKPSKRKSASGKAGSTKAAASKKRKV